MKIDREPADIWSIRFGRGGWGVIVTGQIDVDTTAYHFGNVVIGQEHGTDDLRFGKFKDVATAATSHGSLLLGQLTHVGRQVDVRVTKETIAASAQQLGELLSNSHIPLASTPKKSSA